MHHLPAVTIYNKGGVGGVGVQFGQDGERRQKRQKCKRILRGAQSVGRGTSRLGSGLHKSSIKVNCCRILIPPNRHHGKSVLLLNAYKEMKWTVVKVAQVSVKVRKMLLTFNSGSYGGRLERPRHQRWSNPLSCASQYNNKNPQGTPQKLDLDGISP